MLAIYKSNRQDIACSIYICVTKILIYIPESKNNPYPEFIYELKDYPIAIDKVSELCNQDKYFIKKCKEYMSDNSDYLKMSLANKKKKNKKLNNGDQLSLF